MNEIETETETTGQTKTPKKKYLKVEIYQVPLEDMPNVDALEGHPRWYVRTPVRTLSGDVVEIYNMPLDRNNGISTDEYLALQLESEDDSNIFYNWNR